MFKKKVQKPVHCYEISFYETDESDLYYATSADAAISLFLDEHPNVDDDYLVIVDYGVQKDPDDRK